MATLKVLVAIWLSLELANASEYVTVKTKVGDIEGFVDSVNVDGNTKSVVKFLGIPYAEPPTGNNRFEKPIPKAQFTTKYQAFNYPPSCYQVIIPLNNSPMNLSEDCLFMNIYVPKTSYNTSLPVMVWIHGGAFTIGGANTYKSEALSTFGEVIVVTINYRLGMLGFLRSNDGTLIGNQGLWDQQLAIKWVHDNIASFYGDPNEVTIFGESAGGVSVLLQALYPGNMGYFKRVISESGAAFAFWGITPPNADKILELTGCTNSSDPIRCMQILPPQGLQMKALLYQGKVLSYSPCIDNDFLLESPHDIIYGNNSKSQMARSFFASLDILTGVNNFDGASFLQILQGSGVFTDSSSLLQLFMPSSEITFTLSRDEFINNAIPYIIQDKYRSKCKKVIDDVIDIVSFEYTDWSDPQNTETVRDKLVLLATDAAFNSPAVNTARGHSTYGIGRTYFYEFALNLTQHEFPAPYNLVGSNHADEISFVFGSPISDFNMGTSRTYTENQKEVSRMMMSLWTNFAKTSDPNKPLPVQSYLGESWPQYSMTEQKYVQFTESLDTNKVKQNFAGDRMSLWLDYIPTLKCVFLLCTVIISVLEILLTVIIQRVHIKTERGHKMNHRQQTVTRILANIFCFRLHEVESPQAENTIPETKKSARSTIKVAPSSGRSSSSSINVHRETLEFTDLANVLDKTFFVVFFTLTTIISLVFHIILVVGQ